MMANRLETSAKYARRQTKNRENERQYARISFSLLILSDGLLMLFLRLEGYARQRTLGRCCPPI